MRPLTIPLFISSIGSALDFYPVPFLFEVRRPHYGFSDAQLLASDWNRVGQAIYCSMNSVLPGAEGADPQEAGNVEAR